MSYADLTAEEKTGIIECVRERAIYCEQVYGNCPQSAITPIQEVFGGIDDDVFRASFGLGAGGALSSKGICGALAGAIMVIGVCWGRGMKDLEKPVNRRCFELTRVAIEKFEEKYGSILCHEIQKKIFGRSFDLFIPEDREAFLAGGGHDDKCPGVVSFAACIAAEMILSGDIVLPKKRRRKHKLEKGDG
jgi:C_GCAxxG_C_C family probable redox protein